MKRRDFLKTGSLTSLGVALLPLRTAAQAKRKQPNILWIVTDDQRPDSLACYNRRVSGKTESPLGFVLSPNIDRLAAEGTLFTNAFCQAPACAPSRASFQRGMYPHHIGVYGFERTHGENDNYVPNVGEVMQGLGYHASLFGKSGYYVFKWGPGLTWSSRGEYNAEVGFPRGGWYKEGKWGKDGRTGKSASIGTVVNYRFPDGTVRSWLEPKKGKMSAKDQQRKIATEQELQIVRRPGTGAVIGGVNPMPVGKDVDGRMVAEFERFLASAGKTIEMAGKKGRKVTVACPPPDKPLMVNIGFHFPHSPVLPPKAYREQFRDKNYRVPAFDKKTEYARMPPQLRTIHDKMTITDLTAEQMQQVIQDYYAFCAYGDSLVGKAADAFKTHSAKAGRPWLIVYACGDHGWHLGEQGISAKFGPWDKSTHDAIIVASSARSRFPAGQMHDGLVEFVDMAPTIYAAGGADLAGKGYAHLDGFDLATILRDPKLKRDYIIGEMDHVCGPRAYLRTKEFAFSMRTRPKSAKVSRKVKWLPDTPCEDIRWGLDAPRKDAELALYDLRVDPGERLNVADHEPYLKLADWFRQKLGRIVLGDGRVEVDWDQVNVHDRSDFANGAHDRRLNIPRGIIPRPSLPQGQEGVAIP